MPAMPPTPTGVIKVRFIFALEATEPFGSGYSIAYTGTAPNTTTLGALGADILTAFESHLVSLLSTGGLVEEIIVYDQANPSTPEAHVAGPLAGTRTGVPSTVSTCAVLVFNIAKRYRGARPRSYLPFGVNADTVNGNVWTGTFIAEMLAKWDSYNESVATIEEDGCTLGLPVGVNYYSGYEANPDLSPWTRRNRPKRLATPNVYPVQTFTVSRTLGSQRRRYRVA